MCEFHAKFIEILSSAGRVIADWWQTHGWNCASVDYKHSLVKTSCVTSAQIVVGSTFKADTYYPWTRPVNTGSVYRRPWTRAVNTGVKNDARVHGPWTRVRVHGPWTWVSILSPVFTARVHGRRYTLPVFRGREHGPWIRVVCIGLKVYMRRRPGSTSCATT